jgi:hypothetical protein
MTDNYPIVDQRSLDPTRKRGPFGLGRRLRDEDELLKPNAHEVLVYRVNGQYVMDNASRDGSHEQVVNATHVSQVDMSRNRRVMVPLEIPSSQGSLFSVQVLFMCTVTDPVVVVREGLRHAEATLDAYLRGRHRIFELGQDFRIDQINEVRRDVNAQIKAYTLVSPPTAPGMLVRLAGVEVLTPEEHAKFEHERLAQRQQSALRSEQLNLEHSLDRDRALNTFDLEDIRQRHEQDRDYRTVEQTFMTDAETQRHQQVLAAERGQFERDEFTKIADLVGTDPRRALQLAYAAGRMDQVELAQKLDDLAERDRDRQDAQREQARQDQLRQQDQEREDKQQELQAQREDKLRELAMKREEMQLDREDQRILAEAKRTDQQTAQRWSREDRLRHVEAAREDQRSRLEANLEVLTGLIKQGNFDGVAINLEKVDRFVDRVLEDAQASALDSSDRKELPDSVDAGPDPDVKDQDVG